MPMSLPTRAMLQEMLELQNMMNSAINPNWLDAGADYLRAVAVEGVEAIEHHGWKWWKKQECDLPQVQLELVDIWHFLLSELMVREYRRTGTDPLASEGLIGVIIDQLEVQREAFKEILPALDRLVGTACMKEVSLSTFNEVVRLSGMDWQDIFNMYIAKNSLNIFRQKNGYKTGEYIKTWHGEEDNVHLMRVLTAVIERDSKSIFKDVMLEMEAIYAGVIV